MNRNGFFQLKKDGNEMLLRIFAPEDGFKPVDVKKLEDYLNGLGIRGYKIADLKNAVGLEMGFLDIELEDTPPMVIDEKVSATISADEMLAWCCFYPPSDGGKMLTRRDILDALTSKGISHGINEQKVDELLKEKEYATDYLIAKGTPPIMGQDAVITYTFPTDLSLRPTLNDNGTVDYHELNTICKIGEGEVVARLKKEVPGNPGITVTGKVNKPKDVKSLKLAQTANTTLSEDGTELISNVRGHASLVGGKIFVSGLYEVPADVDNSTGNIHFPGNVSVKGNVKSGFIVQADGDIVVEGVVEGAELYAGGQIIVKRGIHGMNRGVLKAEGNIITKFIESATVKSGNYVETESIIQSTVLAKTNVIVNGNKGYIVGGVVRAGTIVEANTIGSEMGNSTVIEVGVDPDVLEKYRKFRQECLELKKRIDYIKPIVATYLQKLASGLKLDDKKTDYIKKLALELKDIQGKYAEKAEKAEKLNSLIREGDNARIKVHNLIHPGVDIKLSEQLYKVNEERKNCQYVIQDGEIKVISL